MIYMKNCASISLHQLALNVSLGVAENERLQTQTVIVDIDIAFLQPPEACITDQLHHTYCYASLTEQIATQITSQSYHLLEHLAYEIYQLVKGSCSLPSNVTIKVTKKPVLPSRLTLAGASFCYGDR